MRGVALSIVLVIASCGPDYGHTAFRCDADHGCPDGQRCASGRCRRGEPTGDGVRCGKDSGTGAEVTCGTEQMCCRDPFNPPRCVDAGSACPGTAALCDGREDCQAGDRCCADGDTLFCDAVCKHDACREPADCPSTEPNCCIEDPTLWGECSQPPC